MHFLYPFKRRGLGSAHTLWHKSDPTAEEIAKAIEEFDFSDFPEVTFCGYGEPLYYGERRAYGRKVPSC